MKIIRIVAICLCVVAFLYWGWPTPYQYYKLPDSYNVRVNRFTGDTRVLTPYGWVKYKVAQ